MAFAVLKQETGKELRKLFARLADSIRETLGSLIAREVTVQPVEHQLTEAETLLTALQTSNAVVRCALDRDVAGPRLAVLFEVPDAAAMAGLMMMADPEAVAQRRARGTLEGEDLEAFTELGNVLCAGFGNVLRGAVPAADVRLLDHGVVKPGVDAQHLLARGPLFALKLRFRVGDHPETVAWMLLDQPTAEAWNTEPLDTGTALPAAEPLHADDAGAKAEDDLESIPAAPVRGELHAYVASAELLRPLRRSCRRVGLDLVRHSRAEIPNPAAHPGGLVLLDVPPSEERRLDWCRRIKEYAPATKVVLLLHRPSLARVKHAYLSQADLILGMPIDDLQLSNRLGSLLPAPPA